MWPPRLQSTRPVSTTGGSRPLPRRPRRLGAKTSELGCAKGKWVARNNCVRLGRGAGDVLDQPASPPQLGECEPTEKGGAQVGRPEREVGVLAGHGAGLSPRGPRLQPPSAVVPGTE